MRTILSLFAAGVASTLIAFGAAGISGASEPSSRCCAVASCSCSCGGDSASCTCPGNCACDACGSCCGTR